MFPRSITYIVAVCVTLLTIGCAVLPPVQNELTLAKADLSLKVDNPDHTKLVIFNSSNWLMFGIDGTGRINIKLNNKGVTQLNIGQYVQLVVTRGKYQVDLLHNDMFDFPSSHQIEFTTPDAFLEIYATPVSNEALLVPELPVDFSNKFRPVH